MTALRERFGMAGLGLLAIVVSILVTLFFYLGYAQNLFEGKGREVRADFAFAQQLQPGDPVTVGGRREGKVREIEDRDGGRGAIVTFDVAEEAGPLYADATAQLRWKSLLGGSFYLELDRGTPQAGPLGDKVIPRENTVDQVEFEDIITEFQGEVIRGMTTLPGEMAEGLSNPAAVPNLLDTAADASPDLESGLRGLRGAVPDVDLRNLISGSAATVEALDSPMDDLRALVAGAGATLQTTAARSAELRATIDAGPRVTDRVRATLARLDGTLAKADGLVDRLDRSAGELAPTLAALRPTLASTDTLLQRARPLVRQLRPTVRWLATLGRRGSPLLDGLQPSFDRLDDQILPFLSREDPDTGKPTSTMIGGTAAGFGGSAGQQDANGHFIRFPVTSGSSSVYLPCETAFTDPTVEQMLACDSLDKALETYFEYVPKPPTQGKRR